VSQSPVNFNDTPDAPDAIASSLLEELAWPKTVNKIYDRSKSDMQINIIKKYFINIEALPRDQKSCTYLTEPDDIGGADTAIYQQRLVLKLKRSL
ncbi:4057_t:CDS:2, partial [Ambispora leptoticha]